MKIDRNKLDIALANECKVMSDLKCEFSAVTLNRLRNDQRYKPQTKTIGRLAKILNTPVENLIITEISQ